MSEWIDEEGYTVEDNWVDWISSCGLNPDDFEE